MAVGFDPSDDFPTVVDGLESISLLKRGGSTVTTISTALRRELSTAEIVDSDGMYLAGDTRWHVPNPENFREAQIGDIIKDDNRTRFVILEKRLDTLSVRWRFLCRNMIVAYGLDDMVRIVRATFEKTDEQVDESTFPIWKTGLHARIQAVDSEVQADLDQRVTVVTHFIYFEDDLDLDHRDRILSSDGTAYKYIEDRDKGVIGQAMIVEAEKTPWPLV